MLPCAVMGEFRGTISYATRTRRLKAGSLIRVISGIYWEGELESPAAIKELVAALTRHGYALTAVSLYQFYCSQPISFPVHVSTERRITSTKYVVAHHVKRLRTVEVRGVLTECGVDAVKHLPDKQAIALLDLAYSGRHGSAVLRRESPMRVSARVKTLVNRAAVGADSVPERILVRALREAGLECTSNFRVGVYFWDVKLRDYNIVIEVDGYFYHNAGAENKNTFVNDRWKMNDAAVRGYLVLRYPASSVFEELDTIVGQVIFATRVVREELVVVDSTRRWHRGPWEWLPLDSW
ncbi:hypothetical protein FRC0024_00314 [Corynebacterium diphtheriae]|nr:hypothetical protein FRC0024_00314 [Corynebacterium diphtheriae]CAB0717458.1 hypothetical protein FRC0032_02328 [Corynebacterium diphtheriae]CAB0828515.1 hypothetical protein FRC0292_02339 [Corynebacterium diphtheriae]